MKTALVIGSTGLIGSQLLNLLLDSNDYLKVITFVKRDTGIKHKKLTQHLIDFDKPETYKHLVIGDDFFCTIGTTIKKAGNKEAFRKVDFEYPRQFATIALYNKANQYLIVSSLGADANSGNFYLKTKGEIQNFLKDCNFKSAVVVQPSLLLGNRAEFRFGERLGAFFMQTFSFVFQGNLKKYKAIEAKTVAKALLKIAQTNNIGFKIYESDVTQEIGK
ncbi:oxidoreductase [Flavobacterium sp. RSP49]|uniref:oxidoreductase n=1 Tax=Flavobacterium sp. RSP49 TaxID=2497487 RepID=UPI000F839DB7|nr:oxidoreductase [Flavobacterium sp. RSP49]RTY99695.1 oxidoreductase [Flavobacterium sp. RSP49]